MLWVLTVKYIYLILGWYDRKNIGDFRTIIDVNFAAAMGPPGGGRNPVTARLLRHFHYITFLEMETDSKVLIANYFYLCLSLVMCLTCFFY